MGEYAKRLSDGQRVKIGTCQSMYYCRYDQRKDIEYGYSTKDLLWRIPAFEEDGQQPGDYVFGGLVKDGFQLYSTRLRGYEEYFLEEELDKNVGFKQVRVEELGMVVNLPCHHGLRLPETEGGTKFFWNGKHDAIHMIALKNTEEDLLICIRCRACGETWHAEFGELAPYMISLRMLLRLYKQCNEYLENDGEPYKYKIENWEYRHAVGGGDDIHTLHLHDEIDEDGKRFWFASVEHRYRYKEDCIESTISSDFEEVKEWIAKEMEMEYEWEYTRH